MDEHIRLSQRDGVTLSSPALGAVLAGQQQRFLTNFGSFDAKRWQRQRDVMDGTLIRRSVT